MRKLVRLRIALARRPWVVWLLVGLGSVGAAVAMNSQLNAARAERSAWGESRTVLVASGPVSAGTPASAAGLQERRLPIAALPPTAPDHLPNGAVIVRDLAVGEVVVPADVAQGDPRFALVPPGDVLVAIARPEVMAPITPGDAVEVTSIDRDGRATRTPAIVVAVSPTTVLLAIAADDAPIVAAQRADSSAPAGLILVPDH